jgi:hypothetical protein
VNLPRLTGTSFVRIVNLPFTFLEYTGEGDFLGVITVNLPTFLVTTYLFPGDFLYGLIFTGEGDWRIVARVGEFLGRLYVPNL